MSTCIGVHCRPFDLERGAGLLICYLAFASLFFAHSGFAQITVVPPFVGAHSETWEEFGPTDLPSGTRILGGIATISGDHMVTAYSFQMCNARGVPIDGHLLMDTDRPTGLLTISFPEPVSVFGAYWGSGVECCCLFSDSSNDLTFYDVNHAVVGTASFFYVGTGTLNWHGYRFSRPVKTITRIAGDGEEGMAMDGLQATLASESGSSGQLGNVSTRARVLTGDNVLIAGFIVSGTEQKNVLLRGLGPSVPVAGALADPVLELHDSSSTISTNNNWKDTQQEQIEATDVPPSNDLESAVVKSLPAKNSTYTAILRGKNEGTGVGLVEAYDLAEGADSKLANISTRGFVGTGDNVMIGGFIVRNGSLEVLIRAIGPSLPVSDALADPSLELYDGNGASLQANDNWRTDQKIEIIATTIPPSSDLEAAIVRTLPAGNYTAIVRGANNTSGVGLVEVYSLAQ